MMVFKFLLFEFSLVWFVLEIKDVRVEQSSFCTFALDNFIIVNTITNAKYMAPYIKLTQTQQNIQRHLPSVIGVSS